MFHILDGKKVAQKLKDELKIEIPLLVAIYIAGIERILAIKISSGRNKTVESIIEPP